MSTALASDGTLPHMDIMPARDYSAHLPDNLQPLGRSLMPGRPPLERRMVEAVFAALKLLRGPVEGWLGRAVPATKIMNFAWAPAARFVAGGTGQDLIKQLHAALRRKGVEVRTSAPADALLVAPGTPVSTPPTVVGVRTANGCTIAARGGVVLATGGYAHDRALLDAHGIAADATCASPGSVGSAVRLASAAGAEMGLMGEAWWAQSILERALERSNGERGPAGMEATGTIFFMRGSSMLLADAEGKRVVNEKAPYHDRSRVHASGPGRRLLLLVADRAAVDEVGSDGLLTLPQDPADPVYLHGQTVGEIASAADARLAELAARYPASPAATFSFSPDFATNLAATVERFNAMAAAGRDADFARGETPAEQDWEGVAVDTARGINPTMHPLVPPYVALFVCPAILDTKGGPATDASGRVIHAASGEPVVGLYAAGNAAASRAGEAYWQAGTTIGLAMVTGWIAGGHAAGLAAGARERGPTGERR
ncbi:FAD binding domain-containing protein [Hyaloraphidium curvatum]|nr:FAD binding domain-containing protein [Hyaloraphidium curvatum]